ncbi:MAG: hypothetical protein CO093_08750 [Alphaproteobacteria bacterium CG_4_9_14_3_um_filter_47_13]|nr:MAG: hypothetical protein CO093_08750 [Alphaproteobacteria bacterium CG_4_9_14_3_um_filter_47_13]
MSDPYARGQNTPTFNLAGAPPPSGSISAPVIEHQSTPGMEGVRSFVGGAGAIGGEIADMAMHPAGRQVTGGIMGVLGFVLAWKTMPSLTDHIWGLEGDDFFSRHIKGLLSFGMAVAAGFGLYELGNNGFDLQKTKESLGKDWDIAGDMLGNGAGWLDDKITGGRVGATFNTASHATVQMGRDIGTGLNKADQVLTGGIVGDGLNATGEAIGNAHNRSMNTFESMFDDGIDTVSHAGSTFLEKYDQVIGIKPKTFGMTPD